MAGKINKQQRPPVVSIMGHIDHGKSTLLDYIRKTKVVDSEVGGITQKISAYEVVFSDKNKSITFIDTPGHEAFCGMRERGASIADIVILIVSAEDGVKKQTIEAYKQIAKAGVPFIVAITKIDKPASNVERTKLSLAENEIYLEGYGGNISYVPISSKTGEGIDDLLELILLTAEVNELSGNPSLNGTGMIIEAHRDPKKGISATLVIKNGSIKTGMFVASGTSFSPTRIIENSIGVKIKEAGLSSPIRIVGWNIAPEVGSIFCAFETKKELEEYLESEQNKKSSISKHIKTEEENAHDKKQADKKTISVIIKADVIGSLEAIQYEIRKLNHDRIQAKIIHSSIGDITESDVKIAGAGENTFVLGFNVKADNQARALIERNNIIHENFEIIYKLIEWLDEKLKELTPKIKQEEILGKAKIMKCFSRIKDKQIIGGKVIDREIGLGHKVKIMRRETVIGEGIIKELQQAKMKTSSVNEGFEFGSMIEAKIDLAPGDIIEDFTVIEK